MNFVIKAFTHVSVPFLNTSFKIKDLFLNNAKQIVINWSTLKNEKKKNPSLEKTSRKKTRENFVCRRKKLMINYYFNYINFKNN